MHKILSAILLFAATSGPLIAESTPPAPAAEVPAMVYELRTYHAAPGKLDELLTRFRDHTMQLFTKHGMHNIGYWVPIENEKNLLIYLLAYPDREARDASWNAFLEDVDWQKAKADSEPDGSLVSHIDQLFLTETDFSQPFKSEPTGGQSHLFEMRRYTTEPARLDALLARFRDHTLERFKHHGMTNLAYFTLLADQPAADSTLVYFLAHQDQPAAERSWTEFRADPQWIRAKAASEEQAGGSLTVPDGVESVFLMPTDFSPVK